MLSPAFCLWLAAGTKLDTLSGVLLNIFRFYLLPMVIPIKLTRVCNKTRKNADIPTVDPNNDTLAYTDTEIVFFGNTVHTWNMSTHEFRAVPFNHISNIVTWDSHFTQVRMHRYHGGYQMFRRIHYKQVEFIPVNLDMSQVGDNPWPSYMHEWHPCHKSYVFLHSVNGGAIGRIRGLDHSRPLASFRRVFSQECLHFRWHPHFPFLAGATKYGLFIWHLPVEIMDSALTSGATFPDPVWECQVVDRRLSAGQA